MSRAAAMTNRGVLTSCGVVYLTEAQENAMRIGFSDPKRTFVFEADVCSRAVALKLEEKGLVKRSGYKRATLTLTDAGREAMRALRSS